MLWSVCLFAAVGGFLWGFGALGKRVGVEGASDDVKQIRAACTIFIYSLSAFILPLLNFGITFWKDPSAVRGTFGNREWSQRIPFIMISGGFNGLGGLLGTIAFALSANENSALISIVENGTYTVVGALLLALYRRAIPSALSFVSATLIIAGIIFPQGAGEKVRRRLSSVTRKLPFEQKTFAGDSQILESELTSNSASQEDARDIVTCPPQNQSTQRKLATIFLAVGAGACWGVGPLGKMYGVDGAPDGSKLLWSTCTYLVYLGAIMLAPMLKLLFADPMLRRATFNDRQFWWLMAKTILCGLLASIGGILATFAFSLDDQGSALVSVIENGMYTISSALLILVAFKERPTPCDIFSSLLVVIGVVIAGFA